MLSMNVLIKKLGKNELGYQNGIPGEARGQFLLISMKALSFFPKLTTSIMNDTVILNIITHQSNKPSQCKLVYHNSRHHDTINGRNEVRLYLNENVNPGKEVYHENDIILFSKAEFKNEYGEMENSYLITRYRQNEDKDDYKFLLELLSTRSLNRPKDTYAFIDYNKLTEIKRYRERFYEKIVLEGIIPDIVYDEKRNQPGELLTAIAESHYKRNNSKEVSNDEQNELERQLRRMIFDRYDWRCAITNIGFKWTEPKGFKYNYLEGAHVRPRIHDGKYGPENILPMRKEIHTLFDRGLFMINNENKVKLHPEVLNMDGMSDLYKYNEKTILMPDGIVISQANKNHFRQHVYGLFITGKQICRLD